MGNEATAPTGPDLTAGIRIGDIPPGGMLQGRVGDDAVLLCRVGDDVFAIGATCTHYGAPLAEGVLDGHSVHCPWHHACFSVKTGDATRAPALRPLPRWKVERRGDAIIVGGKIEPADPDLVGVRSTKQAGKHALGRVVIAGGGAAGSAAAEMLRRESYGGEIVIVEPDADAPYDRPNISKDYLAGSAPEEWLPVRDAAFDSAHGITRRAGEVAALDPAARSVTLGDGSALGYDALLLATGASARRLPATLDPAGRVRYLRTLRDSRALIAAAGETDRAIVLGASFIGLEVAAALRARGLEVHVVAPEARPLERILGPELGAFIQSLHESHGVRFHLGRSAQSIDENGMTLDDGERIDGSLIVGGVGARLNSDLAVAAGISTGPGVPVDEYLAASAPNIYAAGDIAYWPDRLTGGRIHAEHWAVAQRQGQVAAMNMLGARQRYVTAPFFWSAHYDVTISYVGHAERWDSISVSGDLAARDASVAYRIGERVAALATVGRDRESLRAGILMEQLA
ncbi:MAG TPA: FAD-dependent oxidoreductase [Gemmatimonadaceae bacterium]|nr:FAD-dependent oxidoreductase [Gemmatimonadaceae bacterium]